MLVGKDKKSFTVHKSSICNKSPYFVAACSEIWKENEDGIVTLSHIEANTFNLYVHWVYTGKVDPGLIESPDECDNHEYESCDAKCRPRAKTVELAKLYVAGDSLLDPSLQNHTIDQLQKRFENSLAVIKYTWANTRAGCALRRCVMDYTLLHSTEGLVRPLDRLSTNEFIIDLVNRQFELFAPRKGELKAQMELKGTYHDHGNDSRCTCSVSNHQAKRRVLP